MELGTQVEVALSDLITDVVNRVDPSTLSFYHPRQDMVVERHTEESDEV